VGTLAYGITAGALAATAIVYLLIAIQRRRSERLFFAFGAFSFMMAVTTIVTVWLQKSGSVDEYTDLLKLFGVVSLLALLTMVGLVQAWTGAIARPVFIAYLVGSAVIAVLQLTLPAGLLAGEVSGLRTVNLFGETFVVHEAESSPWRPVLDLFLLATLVIIALALWRGLRRGPRAEAAVLASGIGVFILVSQYDSLVDEGVANTPYLAPFGALVMVGVAAWHLARRMTGAERQLAEQATELEATVIERTAALMDANRRLEQQLAHQRLSVERLAALAQQFEAVNALALRTDTTDDLEHSLRSVLANLGDLLDARSITLRLTDPAPPVPADISWQMDEHLGDRDGERTSYEPIVIGEQRLGELVVEPADRRSLDTEEQRYIELTCDHLAGFLDRLELSDQIAASAVDAERHRIARELHDSVTQKLYSISFLADAVPALLEDDPDRASETVGRMRVLMLSSLAELRTLLFELQPEALAAAPLPRLLTQLAETFDSADSLTVTANVEAVTPLSPPTKLGFYRIAQEVLSNATRHSGSDDVTLELAQVDGVIELVVRDRGAGFDMQTTAGGHGLANMRQRATALGADLEVDTAVGGTSVMLRWKVRGSERSGEQPTADATVDPR
jgi:signal transduction histidine kinase